LLLDTGTTGATSVAFAGGSVDLRGQTYVTGMMPSYDSGTGILTVGSDTLDVGLGLSSGLFTAATDHNGGTLVTEAPCYVAGTTILTERGEVPVESLRPGDRVITAARRLAPVRWVGRMRVDLARHPSPQHAQPIRIAANAFSSGVPCRDLLVSPDHALLAEGVLIPARRLVNGASIRAETALDTVTYVHVELDCHDLLLAEGLAAESYLDTGNRGLFSNAVGPLRTHPAVARRIAEARACAPQQLDPAAHVALRRRLLARAPVLGRLLTEDPDFHVLADGMQMPATRSDFAWTVQLPAGVREVRLRSRVAVPAHIVPDSADRRTLGVAVTALDGQPIPPTDPRRASGWLSPEPVMQWTNGDAVLRCETAGSRPRQLEIGLAPLLRYWLPGTPPRRLPVAA